MKISKDRYLQGFGIVVVVLGMARCIYPGLAVSRLEAVGATRKGGGSDSISVLKENIYKRVHSTGEIIVSQRKTGGSSRFFKADGSPVKNRIYSVPRFDATFPDQNDVQLVAAQKMGVKPVKDRLEAESRRMELVYVGSNPYFYVDKLHNSIPYLVPRASVLLQDIGRSFYDSLTIKGIPLHKIVVTSVLRTQADVDNLRAHNRNAKQNSCHQYGTTFDIAYNRYKTVEAPGESRREVRNDTLKWIFSEVLRDMHKAGRCYIKYEVHQGCFHITAR